MTTPPAAHAPTALELAEAIRTGQRTAVQVMEEHLVALDLADEVLNLASFRDDATALRGAHEVDAALTGGRASDLGPFAGVPMLVKDLNDVEGWPTTLGSEGAGDSPRPADSLPVARLRAAGFVFSAKTTTPEFGSISVTESSRLGATRNPWNPRHSPGGSSGGAGAAVAAGVSPAAHASDGGGSIRIPASCCGLVGLKSSRHRVSNGVEKMASASTQGVVTRTVADQAAILDVLSEPDLLAWSVAPPFARPLAQEVGADPGRLRIRVVLDNAVGIDAAPACRDAVAAAAEQLDALGHHVEEGTVRWPEPSEFLEGFLTVWSTISSGYDLDEDRLEPHNTANRASARQVDSIRYTEALMQLQRSSRSFVEPFGRDFDLLLSPTMAIEPPEVGWIWQGSEVDPGAPMVNATPMAAFTVVFNVTGLPAVSLPVHVADSGLPVGVQLAAPPFDEASLIRISAQMEEAVGWLDRPLPGLHGGS